ncbi:hypothetical protein NYZ99_18925 [Maribacter litopenaei]|uniref:Uncharacterized protein n=1 Tax=Maribacter litopenaei TaxID=2976127 RepID=A0ABY5Y722_9FLAO|nr:hypothetical protein [Maribacter litopenaei]UWX54820.1 hypothetical protein NYZ99_18925 [Maribacter litopenaei]
MKSLLIYFLSFSLMVAILAPSIGTILELDKSGQWVMDVNEEEENNNQETSEFLEKQLIDNSLQADLGMLLLNKSLLFDKNRIEIITSNDIEVSLPPPKL